MTLRSDAAFASLNRLYGTDIAALLPALRLCVVGIGGVGSWAVEAIARSAVGHITMIDHDDVSISNINRQLHALHHSIDHAKVELMCERVKHINPDCEVRAIDDFLAERNLTDYITTDFDAVIDAIDSIRFKAALIAHCKRRRICVITTGGAGGRLDPTAVQVADLSRTWNDALAAKVRSRLRSNYHFPQNPRRRFGVECVFSTEQPVYPDGEGGVTHSKPGVPGVRLDCDRGYGSAGFVTGTFGLVAASRAIQRSIEKHRQATCTRD